MKHFRSWCPTLDIKLRDEPMGRADHAVSPMGYNSLVEFRQFVAGRTTFIKPVREDLTNLVVRTLYYPHRPKTPVFVKLHTKQQEHK